MPELAGRGEVRQVLPGRRLADRPHPHRRACQVPPHCRACQVSSHRRAPLKACNSSCALMEHKPINTECREVFLQVKLRFRKKMYLQAGDPPQSLHLVPILHSGQLLVRPANDFSAFTQPPPSPSPIIRKGERILSLSIQNKRENGPYKPRGSKRESFHI